jgi:diguanylate cyclase (GGDEF)-like protein
MRAEPVALVIDDDDRVHDEVESALVPQLCARVLRAGSPAEGIRMAIEQRPTVILLDINMPGMDGLKVCRVLKESAATRNVPVLFITVERRVEHMAHALECGAVDYIAKPFHPVELQARVRVALRSKQLIDLLKEQARIDALTGLHNRTALEDAVRAAAAAHERTGSPVSLLMVDLDHFKDVNDVHGHGVGDDVLRGVGAAIRRCCRPYDTACRYGGDEFVVIFGQVEGKSGRCAAKRLLEALRAVRVPAGGEILEVHASAGLVTTEGRSAPFDASRLLEAADAALYRAKQAGRDRLEMGALED